MSAIFFSQIQVEIGSLETYRSSFKISTGRFRESFYAWKYCLESFGQGFSWKKWHWFDTDETKFRQYVYQISARIIDLRCICSKKYFLWHYFFFHPISLLIENKDISPICLPLDESREILWENMNYDGYEKPTVVGWGATTKEGNFGDYYILFHTPSITYTWKLFNNAYNFVV